MPLTHTRRRLLRTAGVGLAGTFVVPGLAAAKHPNSNGPPIEGEWMWGSDGTENWWMHGTDAANPANDLGKRPLYVIAPVGCPQSPENNNHAPFAHDHVIDTPGGEGGSYTAVWDPKIVLDPDDFALASIPDVTATPGDGPTVSLIQDLAAEGAVVIVDIPPAPGDTTADFVCPVVSRTYSAPDYC